MVSATYDSRDDTRRHIDRVGELLGLITAELHSRAWLHDDSKLREPEKSAFDRLTPLLADTTYGSPEYAARLAELGEALQHHYAHNRHHPQHHRNGILGMTLVDIVEMYCDWKAASERHVDGSFKESLRINTERFGIDDQLWAIFENTRQELGW